MRFFNEAPFVRLLFPFLLGIIAAVYFLHDERLLVIGSCISVALLILVVNIKFYIKAFRYSWLNGLTINSTLFFLAAQLTLYKTDIRSTIYFSKLTTDSSYVIAQLAEPAVEKEKSMKCLFRIKNVSTNNKSENCEGKALVYLQKDLQSLALQYGDEIIFPSNFNEVTPPQNPGEFNYKRYLAFRNIYHQQYLRSGQWVSLHANNGNPLMGFIYKVRNNLLNKLKAQGVKGDEYAVAAALIIGYNDKLDADIMGAYANTGTLHVLSVSGLHVGLVYIVLNFLFGFVEKFKRGKLIKGIIIIIALWFYAALTGLSPAVLRAATMFSFVVFGQSLRRISNIYNTLAVSCFVLLLVNPFFIFDVGFQLSYIAVIGIVFFQPRIYNWWHSSNYILDQVWKLTSVSIAAQLATLPLSLFYFQQFPNYFLLSNLIVIPLSTAVIYLGLIVFAFGEIPFVGILLGKLFNFLLLFLNGSVKFMERLPYSLWQHISISAIEMCLIYCMIIFSTIYIIKYRYWALTASLGTVMLLLMFYLSAKVIQQKQQTIIVYNIPKTSAIDFISGDKNYLIADTLLTNNKNRMKYYFSRNWSDRGISQTIFSGDNKNFPVSDKFYVLKNPEQLSGLATMNIHCLILSGNCNVSVNELVQTLNFDLLVIDSGNSKRRANNWETECMKHNKKFYNVAKSGAFLEDI